MVEAEKAWSARLFLISRRKIRDPSLMNDAGPHRAKFVTCLFTPPPFNKPLHTLPNADIAALETISVPA
jgi:hypothetical protein